MKKLKKSKKQIKQEPRDLSENIKALMKIKVIFVTLFILMTLNLVYFVAFSSDNLAINTYNPRLEKLEKNIVRGKILDRKGNVLAETVVSDGEEERIYPYENAFSHIIGYSMQGKTGIEALTDLYLLKSNLPLHDKIYYDITHKKMTGDYVVTTLDAELQVKASALLEGKRGAIVAIEPATGKILCMVSKPDFNPNELVLNWENLIKDEKYFPLLNRATQGLYPPGSTFKIMTALEYLMENPGESFSYLCEGADDFNGKVIHCFNNTVHGHETLEDAFAYSCNTAFATIGSSMDLDDFSILTERMLFNRPLPYALPTSKSSFKLNASSNSAQVAETVIGQGETLVTPLHNALIAATVANGGLLMEPYLIDRIENIKGTIVHQNIPHLEGQMIDTQLTDVLTQLMIEVINRGTGVNAASGDYQVAGKTGSAENPFGEAHAWFVGFAPSSQPKIAISIIVENAGSTGSSAVPMAKELIELYMSGQ